MLTEMIYKLIGLIFLYGVLAGSAVIGLIWLIVWFLGWLL